MGMRDILQHNQTATVAVAVIIIVASVMLLRRSGQVVSDSRQIYFYDLGTGKLFIADRALQSPIDAPSGESNGVQAAVYSCGACGEDDMQVAYITQRSAAALAAMVERQSNAPGADHVKLATTIEQGTLIAAPPAVGEQPHWVSTTSRDGVAIQDRASVICGSNPAKPCFPD